MEEKETILLAYAGSRTGRDDKLIDFWLLVTPTEFEKGTVPDGGLGGDCGRVYAGKQAKRYMAGQPGAVYEVPQVKGTTQVYAGKAKYCGLWSNEAQRTEWQCQHRAAVTAAALRKKRKKEGADDNLAALKPVRDAYRKLVSQDHRAALLAQIIAFVTR